MTRRTFLASASSLSLRRPTDATPLIVPIHHVIDSRARWQPDQLPRFWSDLWSVAVRDFQRCGVILDSTLATGPIGRTASRQPVFENLQRNRLNVIVTDEVPLRWDQARGLCGVATRYQGYHLCLIALNHAHGHQFPYVSVNTCVHELLHVFLQDIYAPQATGLAAQSRELRVDCYATRLWLFHDGDEIRTATARYVARLQAESRPV